MVDPFTIHEAETLIAAIHEDWGEAQGNYDEFRFFTGLRLSEQITKARVVARDEDRTKTREDRMIELCPRALAVLKRQLALRERMKRAGAVTHEELSFKKTGEPIRNLQYPWSRSWAAR